MSIIKIENLSHSDDLDREALRAVYGGLFGIKRKLKKVGRAVHKASRVLHSNFSRSKVGSVSRALRWSYAPMIMGNTYPLARSGGRIGDRR